MPRLLCASEENEDRTADELIEQLREGYKAAAQAGEYKATTTIYHGHTAPDGSGDSTNAIVFELDHRDNYSVIMYWAYTKEDDEIHYSNFFQRAGARHIF